MVRLAEVEKEEGALSAVADNWLLGAWEEKEKEVFSFSSQACCAVAI